MDFLWISNGRFYIHLTRHRIWCQATGQNWPSLNLIKQFVFILSLCGFFLLNIRILAAMRVCVCVCSAQILVSRDQYQYGTWTNWSFSDTADTENHVPIKYSHTSKCILKCKQKTFDEMRTITVPMDPKRFAWVARSLEPLILWLDACCRCRCFCASIWHQLSVVVLSVMVIKILTLCG